MVAADWTHLTRKYDQARESEDLANVISRRILKSVDPLELDGQTMDSVNDQVVDETEDAELELVAAMRESGLRVVVVDGTAYLDMNPEQDTARIGLPYQVDRFPATMIAGIWPDQQ
jgi:hypothetical protein